MKMTSTKLSPQERTEAMPAEDYKGPTYPYGTRISLDDELLEKLGLDKLPAVGGEKLLVAKVSVISASENEHQDEGGKKHKRRSLELQITEMCLESASKKDAAETLYDGNAKE